VVARVLRGRSSFSTRGKTWRAEPGTLQIQTPGDVHRDLARDGPIHYQIVNFPTADVERELGAVDLEPCIAPGDPRGAAIHHLHDAIAAGADRLTLEVATVEAMASLRSLPRAKEQQSRAVRRAREVLRDRIEQGITLDQLAADAGLGKFRLCRAFRAQVGLAPHAYLTHLRIARAKRLLRAGIPATEVAQRVGMYDQSQLHRHFRRIVGVTPRAFARGDG
jgi:AraC-like DNA-binding protein